MNKHTRLPRIITSSVARSAYQGESHGGIYLIDLETGEASRKVNWNTSDIDWEGRGDDRGLRGIAFYNNELYISASDGIIVYDATFHRGRSPQNRYLRHCHEIAVHQSTLYISFTGFDTVLAYDLRANYFVKGYCARLSSDGHFSVIAFDPGTANGPTPGDSVHLNSVFADNEACTLPDINCPSSFRSMLPAYTSTDDRLQLHIMQNPMTAACYITIPPKIASC